MKKLYSFSIALIVLLLMAASASAVPDNPKPMKSHLNGDEAYSYFELYDGSSWTSCYADVFKSSNGKDTTLSFYIYGYDASGQWFEYDYDGPIDKECVDVGKDYISLEVLQLPATYVYNYPSEIDVKFTWEKDGEYTSKVNSISTYEGTTYKENYVVSSAAPTEILINGMEIVPNWYYADIYKINSVSVS